MREKISELILDQINAYNEELDEKIDTSIGKQAILFGKGTVLDSVDLVSLIVSIEQAVEDTFDQTIILADARAMSQKNSPFRTVGTLSDYIAMLLKEESK